MSAQKLLSFVPVLDTAIYASGDVMFVAKELAGVMSSSGGAARLESLVVIDKDNEKATFDLLFFDRAPASSLGALNAAYALVDADADNLLGRLSVAAADYVSSGTNSAEATYKNLQLMMKSASRFKSLWICGVIRSGTPTFTTASDLTLKLGFTEEF